MANWTGFAKALPALAHRRNGHQATLVNYN